MRTRIQTINSTEHEGGLGIDASLQYEFDGVLGGALTIGVDGTYNLKYEQGANLIEGIEVRAADDYVGTRGTNGSLPRWKGSAFLELAHRQPQSALGRRATSTRWTTRA